MFPGNPSFSLRLDAKQRVVGVCPTAGRFTRENLGELTCKDSLGSWDSLEERYVRVSKEPQQNINSRDKRVVKGGCEFNFPLFRRFKCTILVGIESGDSRLAEY